MSYLLTEISLEMLGYKFYDIDGNFGQTNFQSNLPSSNLNNEDTREEESLATILNLMQTANEEQNEDNGNNTLDALDVIPSEELSAAVDSDTSHTQQKESTLQPLQNIKRNLPNALSKLLDNECERIRNQILRNKIVFVQTNADMVKLNDQRGTLCDCLTPFKEQEKTNLQNELHTMQMFRKLVERSLFKVRSDSYEKYKRIFVPTAEDTPIVIDNV